MVDDKFKVLVFSSCVMRDVAELLPQLVITNYITKSSISSAFEDVPFSQIEEKIIEEIPAEFNRRSVKQDLQKKAKNIMEDNEYKAILLDYIEERFEIIISDGQIATNSDIFASVVDPNIFINKLYKLRSLKKFFLWRKGLKRMIDIANTKNVPIILLCAYPTLKKENGNIIEHSLLKELRKDTVWLFLLHLFTPRRIKKIIVPRKLSLMALEHKWGGNNIYHYIPEYYEYAAKKLSLLLKLNKHKC